MKNNIKSNYMIAAMILSTPALSIAKDISYDHIRGSYVAVSIDTGTPEGDLDGSGFSVSGSVSVAPNVALTASLASVSYDEFSGVNIDTTGLSFGVTAHTSIADGTDVFGGFSVLRGEIEFSDGFNSIGDDDIGNTIGIGVRHLANESVEIEIGISREDIFDESENKLSAGARFYANEKVSLGIGYSSAVDTDALILSVRADFR